MDLHKFWCKYIWCPVMSLSELELIQRSTLDFTREMLWNWNIFQHKWEQIQHSISESFIFEIQTMKRKILNAKYWWDDEQNIITIHQILSHIVITVWILGYFIFLKLQKKIPCNFHTLHMASNGKILTLTKPKPSILVWYE